MMTHTGTLNYSAPEQFTQMVYTEKIDLWAAGCILYFMLSGYHPFASGCESNAAKIIKRISNGEVDMEEAPWSEVSSEAKDLVRNLL